jgi:hypothetical protein
MVQLVFHSEFGVRSSLRFPLCCNAMKRTEWTIHKICIRPPCLGNPVAAHVLVGGERRGEVLAPALARVRVSIRRACACVRVLVT